MNNQDVSVERFFRVSSIEYRVSSVNLHLVGTVHLYVRYCRYQTEPCLLNVNMTKEAQVVI